MQFNTSIDNYVFKICHIKCFVPSFAVSVCTRELSGCGERIRAVAENIVAGHLKHTYILFPRLSFLSLYEALHTKKCFMAKRAVRYPEGIWTLFVHFYSGV